MNDAHELMRTGGKIFPTGSRLLPANEVSKRIPDLQAKALDGSSFDLKAVCKEHKCTLLTVSYSEYAENLMNVWRLAYLKEFAESIFTNDKEMGLVDLRPIPTLTKWLLWSGLVKFLQRRKIHRSLLPRTVVYRGGEEMANSLGYENMMGGYLFLVDPHGGIRWWASGAPEDDAEMRLMTDTAWVLREESSSAKRK